MKVEKLMTLEQQIEELERRQEAKGWNKDRAKQLDRLKRAKAGSLNNVSILPLKREGQFAVRTGSTVEQRFAALAAEAGWTISKRGWPDFFMWKDGKLACVEVKGDLEGLRANQKAVLEALAAYGVPCFTWRPLEGFKRITGKEVESAVDAAG
jgi:hypothetical protein